MHNNKLIIRNLSGLRENKVIILITIKIPLNQTDGIITSTKINS